MASRRYIPALALAVALIACGKGNDVSDSNEVEIVTLKYLTDKDPVTPQEADDLICDGRFTTSLPIDNPAAALGTNHAEDEGAQERIDAFLSEVEGAERLIVHRGGADPNLGSEPLYQLSGCVENQAIVAEVQRLGGAICDPSVLGRSITFANVQLARVAPDGPYHIYDDYVVQTLPLLLAAGGCVVGAWLCESDERGFDGIFIPAYPSAAEMLQVADQTSSSGPGGTYGEEATYADLRYGGVEIMVRNLIDLSVLTP